MELGSLPRREAEFIEPMECLAVTKIPDGAEWIYEVKLDGYRAIAVNSHERVFLYSRRRKNFNQHYPFIAEALKELPENTVVDGEIVVLDGRILNFSLEWLSASFWLPNAPFALITAKSKHQAKVSQFFIGTSDHPLKFQRL